MPNHVLERQAQLSLDRLLPRLEATSAARPKLTPGVAGF